MPLPPPHPAAPRPGQILFSRSYGASEDDSLDTAVGSNPVTGPGYLCGVVFNATANGVGSVFDQTSGGILIAEFRHTVVGLPFQVWPPEMWRPIREGAQVVTTSQVVGLRLLYTLREVGDLVA